MSEATEDELTAIIKRIEALLTARSTPEDVSQAIEDVFLTYGQIAQIREVLVQLVGVIRALDQSGKNERAEIKKAITTLVDSANTPVRALDDKVNHLAQARGARLRELEHDMNLLAKRIHQLEDEFLDSGQVGQLAEAMHRLAVEIGLLKARMVGDGAQS